MRDHVVDLLALLDELGIERPHLVGTSYGGEVGMMFAIEHPDRVRSLAAIACVSHVEPSLRDAVVRWRDVARDDPETLLEISAPYNFSPGVITPSFIEQGRERLRGYGPAFFRNLADLCDAFLRLNITERLHEIRCPMLVMCGENDILKPVHYSRIIAERVPNAQLEIVAGAPHAMVLETHDVVNRALLQFLRD
jgi:3-oxoadipate enol-lactonase